MVVDANHPSLIGTADPVQQLVYAAGPEHVESVYIAGQRKVHKGTLENWGPALNYDLLRTTAQKVRERASL